MNKYKLAFYIAPQFLIGISIETFCDFITFYIGPIYIMFCYGKNAKGIRFFKENKNEF